jgi:hypothetical protein
MGSELQRFGFTGDGNDDRWKASVEKFLLALLTNPHLNIGDTNSEVRFPPQSAPGRGGGDTTITTAGLNGAFCHQYVDEAGDTYLQGGTITGSNGGSATIADYKTKDAADTPPLSDSGDRLYLSCNVTATLANGVVQPGVLLNSATLTKTLPTAHTFSTAALTGVVFREIGRWTDTEFLPSGACGLSTVSGCPGSFAIV